MADIVNLATRIERLKSNTERDTKRLEDELKRLEQHMKSAGYRASGLPTPRRYYTDLVRAKVLPSAAQSCLDGLTQMVGNKHYRYITQSAIAKQVGKSIDTIKRGMKLLQQAGILFVQHVYKLGKRKNRKPSPTRSASLVWIIGLSRLVASQIQLEDLSAVSARKFHAGIKPSTRAELGQKVPPEDKFLSGKNKVLKWQTATNSFIDTLAVGQAGKSASPERES